MQQALLGLFSWDAEPAFDARFGSLQRIELANGAWVEHQPHWLDGHEHVFRELEAHAAWHSQRRWMYEREVDVPRRWAQAPREGAMGRLLQSLAHTLGQRYQRCLESITLAYYRNGTDSVAFHGDEVGRWVDDCVVATVSVGAPRRFSMRPTGGGASLAFELGWGDLLVMGGTCQRSWQHAVPKRVHADPRISIMFRPRV